MRVVALNTPVPCGSRGSHNAQKGAALNRATVEQSEMSFVLGERIAAGANRFLVMFDVSTFTCADSSPKHQFLDGRKNLL